MSRISRRDWAVFATVALVTGVVVLLALLAPTRWAIAGLGILLGFVALLSRAQLVARRSADQRLRSESRATREATKHTLDAARRILDQMAGTRKATSSAVDALRAAKASESVRTTAMRAELRGIRVSQQLASQTTVALRGEIADLIAQSASAATKEDVAEFARQHLVLAQLGPGVGVVGVAELQRLLEQARAAELRGFSETIQPSIQALTTEIRRQHPEIMTDFQAIQQLFQRFEPRASLPPIAGWAVSPSGLLSLVDQITERDAELVVECGSGSSTLWMALAMRAKGRGKVVAFEHLKEYADKTNEILRAHGVEDWAEVRVAPLTEVSTAQGVFQWYDVDVDEWQGAIDILLVDGPPAATGRHARYPALPLLARALKSSAMIVVDDTERQDEAEVVALWKAEWPDLTRIASPGRGIEVFALVNTFV